MEFKNSFLAWLFGTKDEAEDEPEEEELVPSQTENAQPEEPPRHRLELPPDHALRKLWSIYVEQSGWQPVPNLTLEGPSDPLLPDETGRTELLRLQMAVNSSANGRFELLRPKQKTAEEGQTSLPDLNAQVTVFLSKDCMTAWLLVYPPVGAGRELDRAMLDQALRQQKVRFGLDRDLLVALPQDPERYFRLVTAARGSVPVNGADGYVEDDFPRSQEKRAQVDEHNRIDYADLGFIHNVEEGAVICRLIPPGRGTPGRTVQGEAVPAKDGRAASLPKGRNTHLSEDGQALLASIAGHVEFSGRSFQVQPVMDISGNVDFSVGNINFLGDVCIQGDVHSGFTVRAMGNITVNGVVEACTLEAGRNLVVARGVQGDNQAVIRAQQSVIAKYLENCCVYAKESLESECIINCDVYCDGEVSVCSGHSKIIGGKVQAAHEVKAGVIGSRVGNRTEIILGGRPCEEFDYELLVKEIQGLEESLEQAEQQPESPDKSSRLARLRMQLMVSRGKLEAIEKDRMFQAAEPQDPGVRRMECDTVFPGTVLKVDDAVCRVREKLSPCVASLVDGEIHLI